MERTEKNRDTITEDGAARGQSTAPCYIAGDGVTLVSFSGGETSGYMSLLMKQYSRNKLVFVFVNTGQENEETLEFVDKCDKHFGLNVVWVEAVVQPDGVGTKHRVVDFFTASRNGEPFEAVMAKYGISNKAYPHCTRELKEAPIHSYMKTITNEYHTAIGIRADEYRRVTDKKGLIYPLADYWLIDKEAVKRFWEEQPFNLGLYDYQGNCKWCWKKSLRKHFKLIDDDPTIFDFPAEMEEKYGKVRCPEGQRVFFRENRSTADLFEAKHGRVQLNLFDIDDGCSESCEMYEAI